MPIAEQAIKEDYEVHLLCKITDHEAQLEYAGITVHDFSFSRSRLNPISETITFLKLYLKILEIKPDIVHLVTIKPVLYGGICARLASVHGVVSAISGLGYVFSDSNSVRKRVLKFFALHLYKLAMKHRNQRVIFQNSADKTALIRYGGVDEKKAVLIHGSGVNLNTFRVEPEKDGIPVVLMASRLLKNKGVVEFVEAAKIVKSRGVKAEFRLAGGLDTDNPESVEEMKLKLWQSEDTVHIMGQRSDMENLFAQAHVVVLPSYYGEGLPKVLAEAAASGRAIITTNMPGCRDAIIPDITGILVAPKDIIELAEAMQKLILDKQLRLMMGKNARDLAEKRFCISKVISTHIKVYDRLIEK